MIFILRTEEPEILRSRGNLEQMTLCAQFYQGATEFKFKNSIYAHETVKRTLRAMQHCKCCFCESSYEATSYGHVEHYRPKAGYNNQDNGALQKPGYYWLAYAWDNLLLSCQLCNQHYKKNLFPLLIPENRARNHHDSITAEQPLLINPCVVNPQGHIGFRKATPYAINGSPYGVATIAILGLDREGLEDNRRKVLAEIDILYRIVKCSNKRPDILGLQELAKEAKQKLGQFALPTAQYSAMVGMYIGRLQRDIS